jgi:hypothetical protein
VVKIPKTYIRFPFHCQFALDVPFNEAFHTLHALFECLCPKPMRIEKSRALKLFTREAYKRTIALLSSWEAKTFFSRAAARTHGIFPMLFLLRPKGTATSRLGGGGFAFAVLEALRPSRNWAWSAFWPEVRSREGIQAKAASQASKHLSHTPRPC